MQRLRAEDQIDAGRPLAQQLALLAGDAAADADHHAGPARFQGFPESQLRKDLFLGLFADGAGIEQQHIGLLGIIGALQIVGRAQDIRHPGGVVFVHLATVGLDVQFAGHG